MSADRRSGRDRRRRDATFSGVDRRQHERRRTAEHAFLWSRLQSQALAT